MRSESHLLIKPDGTTGTYHRVTPATANWNYLSFGARAMSKGEQWEHHTGEDEMAIVLLGGNFQVESDKGNWETVNGRKDVFGGVAHTLYIPRNSRFVLTATSAVLDIAYGWCRADADHPAKFVRPEQTPVVIFGGDNATRQFNDL